MRYYLPSSSKFLIDYLFLQHINDVNNDNNYVIIKKLRYLGFEDVTKVIRSHSPLTVGF